MGLDINYIDGQTPLDEEEKDGLLIPSITTRAELDEFEQQNIERAIEWTLRRKSKKEIILTSDFIKELHFRMFNDVWKWAGQFRKTNKNIGVNKSQINIALKTLLDDASFWVENNTYPPDELAIRFKHRLVNIHCFANGNGRHSRLMADIIIKNVFGKPVFAWSGKNLNKQGDARKKYITAIREADDGNINPLIQFAR